MLKKLREPVESALAPSLNDCCKFVEVSLALSAMYFPASYRFSLPVNSPSFWTPKPAMFSTRLDKWLPNILPISVTPVP